MSGNPGGRPKTKPITDALKYALAQVDPKDKEGRTYAQILAEAAIRKAIKGSYEHLREVGDRVEGRATQRTELTGADGGPVDIANLTPEQRDAEIRELAQELGFTRNGE